jgi:tetratricopeptide (TPR) repeat protein
LNADRTADARELLQGIVTARPGDLQARYMLAQAQRNLGDLAAAEQTGLALRDLAPTDSRGPVVLSQVYADRREHGKVIEVLTPLLEARGNTLAPAATLGLVLRLASAHLALGQYDPAIALLDEARKGRDEAMLDAYLLQALVAGRRFERAVEVGTQLRAARPKDPQPARLLARALQGLGRTDEAVALLSEQRDAHPDDPLALVALADALSQASRHDDAVAAIESGEARFGGELAYWFQRGAVLERAGRHAPAEQAFRKALSIDPQHAPTLNYLGYMFAEQGERLDEAVRLVRQALAIDPDNGSYLDSLGWAFFKQGNVAEARGHLERAAALLEKNSVIQDHLGDVLWVANDRSAAIAAWERALAGDGESVDPDEIRRKIERARQR